MQQERCSYLLQQQLRARKVPLQICVRVKYWRSDERERMLWSQYVMFPDKDSIPVLHLTSSPPCSSLSSTDINNKTAWTSWLSPIRLIICCANNMLLGIVQHLNVCEELQHVYVVDAVLSSGEKLYVVLHDILCMNELSPEQFTSRKQQDY